MNKNRNPNGVSFGHVVGAVIFILVIIGLVLFAAGYNADDRYSNGFFNDVSSAVHWR